METIDLYLLGDVARMLEVPQYRLSYLLTVRRELEPALRVGNRRMFTTQEVERLRIVLNTKEKSG